MGLVFSWFGVVNTISTQDKCLKKNCSGEQRGSSQVRMFDAKPDGLSLVLRTSQRKERGDCCKWPLPFTHAHCKKNS